MATGSIELASPAEALIANRLPNEPLLNGDVLYEVVGNQIRELPPMGAGKHAVRFESCSHS